MFLDTGMPPQGDYTKAFPKNPALLPYIHSYVSIISEVEDSTEQYITRFFPSFMTQFVFDFYGSLNEVVEEGSVQLTIDKGTYVKSGIGTWMDFFQKESSSSKRLVKSFKVTLYPHVLYEVFGISPFEIKYETMSVNDIWGRKEGELLFEELAAMDSSEGMIDVFERYFIAKLSKKSSHQTNIYPYLLEGHTFPTLKTLSKECGYSERWIQKQYLEIFGESFKHIQNNARFIKTLRFMNHAILQGDNHLKLVSVAYQCDYFDQTHFIKEFKKFTGLTPSYYFHTFRDKIPLSWLW
ncbi:helix-turn-helix domain-containing protein [Sulfurospirillum sp.]|uniref:helix-turn-helix domain-containing protein n=1 Tax=Sulfurospirillum sp. TaxID=2053622 RepID=UPI002FDE54D3